MKATLIDHMGSDLTVVNAARVSFAKTSELVPMETGVKEYSKGDIQKSTPNDYKWKLSAKDAKLINYLAEHNHWSPFSHPQIQLHVKAPIFVIRQLEKHTVGLTRNEVSRRYVSDEPELFFPESWRGKSTDKKQGSEGIIDIGAPDDRQCLLDDIHDAAWECVNVYNKLIEAGVAPEQARMILPMNTYSEFYWTGSLYAFARVCNLRCKPDTQLETQQIANQIKDIITELFPVSAKALLEVNHESK